MRERRARGAGLGACAACQGEGGAGRVRGVPRGPVRSCPFRPVALWASRFLSATVRLT